MQFYITCNTLVSTLILLILMADGCQWLSEGMDWADMCWITSFKQKASVSGRALHGYTCWVHHSRTHTNAFWFYVHAVLQSTTRSMRSHKEVVDVSKYTEQWKLLLAAFMLSTNMYILSAFNTTGSMMMAKAHELTESCTWMVFICLMWCSGTSWSSLCGQYRTPAHYIDELNCTAQWSHSVANDINHIMVWWATPIIYISLAKNYLLYL